MIHSKFFEENLSLSVVFISKELIGTDEGYEYRNNKILEYQDWLKMITKELRGQDEYTVFPRIGDVVAGGKRVICRIAVESLVDKPRIEKNNHCIEFVKKFPSPFAGLPHTVYVSLEEFISQEKTCMFFSIQGTSQFDTCVVTSSNEDTGNSVFRFPATYQAPIIAVEIDQDHYISLIEYQFSEVKKGPGIIIKRFLLHCAKAPSRIDKDAVCMWLPPEHMQYSEPVLQVMMRQKATVKK